MSGIYSTSHQPRKIPPLVYVPDHKEIIDGKVVTILRMERATSADGIKEQRAADKAARRMKPINKNDHN